MFKNAKKNDVTVNTALSTTEVLKCGVAYEVGILGTALAFSLVSKGVKKATNKIKEKESEDK